MYRIFLETPNYKSPIRYKLEQDIGKTKLKSNYDNVMNYKQQTFLSTSVAFSSIQQSLVIQCGCCSTLKSNYFSIFTQLQKAKRHLNSTKYIINNNKKTPMIIEAKPFNIFTFCLMQLHDEAAAAASSRQAGSPCNAIPHTSQPSNNQDHKLTISNTIQN